MTSKNGDCTINYQEHWDIAFSKNATERLGWYEKKSQQTLDIIEKLNLSKDASILNVGSGSSTLVDDLVNLGYTNLIATDISSKALENAQERLGENKNNVRFIVDDLTDVKILNTLKDIDLWNDRAVLHFFLKKEQQRAYVNLMKKVIRPKGYAIIAAFSLEGHEKCCGLQLQRYNASSLQKMLGSDFELLYNFDYTFVNPYGGERPYVYTLFQKK